MASEDARNLRFVLKTATRREHDALDGAMGSAALTDDTAYTAFLATQYAARLPLERWARVICPADMLPPQQTGLIARDLATLGLRCPEPTAFAPPRAAGWIGLAWALGGSSMGNRAMLAQRRKAGLTGPLAFLSDSAMPAYFQQLLPLLRQQTSDAAAAPQIEAARAVFDCFQSALAGRRERLAA